MLSTEGTAHEASHVDPISLALEAPQAPILRAVWVSRLVPPIVPSAQ